MDVHIYHPNFVRSTLPSTFYHEILQMPNSSHSTLAFAPVLLEPKNFNLSPFISFTLWIQLQLPQFTHLIPCRQECLSISTTNPSSNTYIPPSLITNSKKTKSNCSPVRIRAQFRIPSISYFFSRLKVLQTDTLVFASFPTHSSIAHINACILFYTPPPDL